MALSSLHSDVGDCLCLYTVEDEEGGNGFVYHMLELQQLDGGKGTVARAAQLKHVVAVYRIAYKAKISFK